LTDRPPPWRARGRVRAGSAHSRSRSPRTSGARRQRGIAVAGGDVEHLLAGPEVERLAQLLADDLQRGADDGVVAGRPGAVLLGLEGGKVDLAGLFGLTAVDVAMCILLEGWI
jgi:hypothetical protein